MEVQIATLCDAATDQNGKLNILGAFDTIVGGQTPVISQQCAMALRLSFLPEDEGEHDLVVSILDPDGTPVIPPFEANFGFEFPKDEGIPHLTRNVVYFMNGVKYEKEGQHTIDVRCDGEILARRPLMVLVRPDLMPPQPQQQAPQG